MHSVYEYIAANRDRFESELFEFLRIASVSADSRCKPEIQRAARFVEEQLRSAGLETEVWETSGNPVVFGGRTRAPAAPTLLVYGHYDVQPPDPLDLWITPPFEPSVRDGNVYARGATDDKGQVFAHFKAIEAWTRAAGELPVNVKVVVEGEEEVGSVALSRMLPEVRDKLACDYVVVSDSSMFAPDAPAITYGLRGICYFELFVDGPRRDLHSGTFGGAVKNPVNALCEILGRLVDADGRIQIPGFYDDVVEIEETEKERFRSLDFSDDDFRRELGVDELFGEAGRSTLERRWSRPTCDVHGVQGGYAGEGAKTVLPAKASAKFSFRLVPNQDPQRIEQGVRRFIEERRPPGVRTTLVGLHGARAVATPLDSPGVRAAERALAKAFGRNPVFIREGGSIPIVGDFKSALGADALLLGFGLNDDNTHSPNEKFRLKDFHRGVEAAARLMEELASAP
jgi:acetylornithine deacetylase/succinyl-diaminopimelate desuccinylase-like protein